MITAQKIESKLDSLAKDHPRIWEIMIAFGLAFLVGVFSFCANLFYGWYIAPKPNIEAYIPPEATSTITIIVRDFGDTAVENPLVNILDFDKSLITDASSSSFALNEDSTILMDKVNQNSLMPHGVAMRLKLKVTDVKRFLQAHPIIVLFGNNIEPYSQSLANLLYKK